MIYNNLQTKSIIDTNRIAKTNTDLENFCHILNESINGMKKRGVIAGEITEAMVKELAMLNAEGIKSELRKSYEAESSKISIPFERRKFLESMNQALAKVEGAVEELGEIISQSSLKLPLRETGSTTNLNAKRLKYLVLKDGVVSFDRAKVVEDNTYKPSGEAEDFIMRAALLHRQLVDFDREVRLLSGANGNMIYGIGEADSVYCDSLISVGDGVINLDLRLIKLLDFANADELLKSNRQFENSKIWGKELYQD